MAGQYSSYDIFQSQCNRQQFQQWFACEPDIDFITHAAKAAVVATDRGLTEKQRLYFTEYHVNGHSIAEIADIYGVNKSTVSRTITAAHKKLVNVLRYSAPHLMNAPIKTRNRRAEDGK